MRIAIIGAGISGNLAARLLAQRHDVDVFEAADHAGGHAHTSRVHMSGRDFDVDVGFMVFNERTYPNFCRLLRLLNVSAQDTDMSFSVRCDATGLEYQGGSLNGLFAQRRNVVRPMFLRMLRDILRFHREAPQLLDADLGDATLLQVLEEHQFGGWFVDKYLAPMAAAIWSCSPGKILDFPARFLLAFLRNHGLLQLRDRPRWRTVQGGARRYVERLLAPLRDRVRPGCPVEWVRRHADHVVVQPRRGPAEVYDAVVMAAHADQTLAMLQDADAREREILEAFPFQRNTALLHTDTSLLPQRRRAWASWNHLVPREPGLPVAVTYDLSRLQRLDTPTPILLTLNGAFLVDPSKVLDRMAFQHPLFTRSSPAAQARHGEINGRRRTYYCGAYWGHGFHEDGVNSALAVARCFNESLDTWRAVSTRASFTTNASGR